ncbi:MAG: YihY/virulence factor BrkB family protein [Microcella sp.]
MIERAKNLAARVQQWRIVRAVQRYLGRSGPILASGLAYRALFASFAGLWVGFAIAGTVVSGNIGLQDAVLQIIAQAVPGLIDLGEGGAIDAQVLLDARVFGVTGVIALVGLFITALGFLHALRGAVRQLFHLPPAPDHLIWSRLRDVGLALGFGLLLIVSAVLSVVGTQATAWMLDVLGISDSTLALVLGRSLSLLIMFGIDYVALVAAFRVLSEVALPWRYAHSGALLGALALGVLKVVGTLLLGGTSSNPLIASFAVILGLLIWFSLVCQVILLSAAWIATRAHDAGEILDRAAFEARLESARALVREHGLTDDEPERPGFWARVGAVFRAPGRG